MIYLLSNTFIDVDIMRKQDTSKSVEPKSKIYEISNNLLKDSRNIQIPIPLRKIEYKRFCKHYSINRIEDKKSIIILSFYLRSVILQKHRKKNTKILRITLTDEEYSRFFKVQNKLEKSFNRYLSLDEVAKSIILHFIYNPDLNIN